MKVHFGKLCFASIMVLAAVSVADEQMPNPGGSSNCFKLVNTDACTRKGITNTNPLACSGAAPKLVVTSPSAPQGADAAPGEAGKKSVVAGANVFCIYRTGSQDEGGGCTWSTFDFSVAVTPISLAGQDCTGKPPCPPCEE